MKEVHGKELLALWSLAAAIVAGVMWLAMDGTDKDVLLGVFGLFGPVLNSVINSIRGLGQSRAMQSMVDQLGKSAPAPEPQATGKPGDPFHTQEDQPLDLGGLEQKP